MRPDADADRQPRRSGSSSGCSPAGASRTSPSVRLRWVSCSSSRLVLRFATQFAIEAGNGIAETLRLPLFAAGFVLLLVGLWVNREQPGLPSRSSASCSTRSPIVTNGGYMPVWEPSIVAAGLPGRRSLSPFHSRRLAERRHLDATSCPTPGPLGDIIPIPIPFIRNVASIGDLFLAAGLGVLPVRDVRPAPERGRARRRAPRGPARRPRRHGPHRRRRRAGGPTSAGASRPATGLASPVSTEAVRPSSRRSSSASRRGHRRPRARAAPRSARAGVGGRALGRRRRRRSCTAPPIEVGARSGATRTSGSRSTARSRAVDRPADQPVRRPHPPDRARVPRPRGDRLGARGRARVPRRDAAEPVLSARSPAPRRPLGPARGHDRQRPAAGRRSSCSSRSPR